MNFRELDYNEWLNEFGPIVPNVFQTEYDCDTYETYGPELVFVNEVYKAGVQGVWTLMEDDNGDTCISEGMAFINRIGYIITKRPYPTDTFFYIKYN